MKRNEEAEPKACPADIWRDAMRYRFVRVADGVGHVGDTRTGAARDVLAERRRQIEAEGWTPEHDDEHSTQELAFAAACYATADEGDAPPAVWPWHLSWWKPTDRRHNLVKAGALILAEIERLDRMSSRGAY